MARFRDWDYLGKNVQSGLTAGQFINSAGCLICAGPPFLAPVTTGTDEPLTTGDVVYPVGLISQWQIGQNLAVVPVPEAGSYRRYTITGPADGSFSFGRTLYHGPNLLKALYAYYRADLERALGGHPIEPLIDNDAALIQRNPKNKILDAPGFENFYSNLCSDLFTQPVGILLYIQDINRESYGAVYLEQLQIANHGIGSGPGNLVVAENANCVFARARPVQLANPVPLMSRLGDNGVITTAGTMCGDVQYISATTGTNR